MCLLYRNKPIKEEKFVIPNLIDPLHFLFRFEVSSLFKCLPTKICQLWPFNDESIRKVSLNNNTSDYEVLISPLWHLINVNTVELIFKKCCLILVVLTSWSSLLFQVFFLADIFPAETTFIHFLVSGHLALNEFGFICWLNVFSILYLEKIVK